MTIRVEANRASAIFISLLLLPTTASAYIDPNTGGFFFQTIAPFIYIGIILIPGIFYLLTLRKALLRCEKSNRAMPPGQVWLQLIPLFNMIWHFFIVINVAKSLHNEFEQRGIKSDPMPGKSLGLAMCILGIISFVPYIGIWFGLISIICWIVYWVKISGYSAQLA